MATVENNENTGFDTSDDEGEYDLTPLDITWIDLGTGDDDKLGVTSLPGCRFKDTWRKLENDIKCLQTAGVEEVFSLCTRGELAKYRVPRLLSDLTEAQILVHHYAFLDGETPSMGNLLKMIDEIKVAVHNYKKPVVHCYGGLGRSCLVAVCTMLMMDESLESEKAIERVRELRGPGAIQSVKQYNFVCGFREALKDYQSEVDTEIRTVSR